MKIYRRILSKYGQYKCIFLYFDSKKNKTRKRKKKKKEVITETNSTPNNEYITEAKEEPPKKKRKRHKRSLQTYNCPLESCSMHKEMSYKELKAHSDEKMFSPKHVPLYKICKWCPKVFLHKSSM